ncbi:hypothetical protein Tco_0540178 [Tanacetum coccineum]
MLAIPLHSQSISMAEIVSKEAQKKSKAGIALISPHTTNTLGFISPKKHKMQFGKGFKSCKLGKNSAFEQKVFLRKEFELLVAAHSVIIEYLEKDEEKDTNTPYLKTLKNSRPLPDFEEYVIDTPYMILWSKIKKNTFSANIPYPKTPILCIGQYSVSKKTDMAYWSIRLAWCFEEQSTQQDVRIADVRRHMDTDLYLHMLTVIVGRRWVLSHGVRLAMIKCDQSSKCCSTLGKFISLAINNGIQ